ncbi:hypothetical protein MTO96_012678 [Rhipicephalus appendiculatus]
MHLPLTHQEPPQGLGQHSSPLRAHCLGVHLEKEQSLTCPDVGGQRPSTGADMAHRSSRMARVALQFIVERIFATRFVCVGWAHLRVSGSCLQTSFSYRHRSLISRLRRHTLDRFYLTVRGMRPCVRDSLPRTEPS